MHVGVRTTLLRAVYEPWLAEAFTLMGFALGTALLVAFLLEQPGAAATGRNQHAAGLLTPPSEPASPEEAGAPAGYGGARLHQD